MRKQQDIDKNNNRENILHFDHDYKVGDKVLGTNNDICRKLICPTQGSKTSMQIYINNTVRVHRRAISELINIRRCIHCTEPTQFGGWGIVGPILLLLIETN